MLPYKLDAKATIIAARKGYEEKRLGAQTDHTCFYRSPDGNPCAIGVGIPDEIIEEAKKSDLFNDVNGHGITPPSGRNNYYGLADFLKVDPQDFNILRELQLSHDTWANGIREGKEDPAFNEKIFLAILGRAEDHYGIQTPSSSDGSSDLNSTGPLPS